MAQERFGYSRSARGLFGGRRSKKIKSSEVVLCPFVSASSSLVRPLPTFQTSLSLRSRRCDLTLGLRAHRQLDKPAQRLGTLSCLRRGLLFLSTSALL